MRKAKKRKEVYNVAEREGWGGRERERERERKSSRERRTEFMSIDKTPSGPTLSCGQVPNMTYKMGGTLAA
jgi:hypothetical protein